MKEKDKLLLLAGILHGKKTFTGPEVLHIDLTNWCNFDCIACWCRSPLLGDKAMPEEERKLILPLENVRAVFDDIAEMGGLKQVKLVGGGEPFMHPDILKVVEYIKNVDSRIEIDINTNFSLVNEKTVERMLELGVDSLTVSIWAGTPGAYTAVHPNQKAQTFERIRQVMLYMSRRKKELDSRRPRMVIHNVILNRNCADIDNMLRFALDAGADDIQFVPIDTVKNKTEQLLPSPVQIQALIPRLLSMRERYNPENFTYTAADGRVIVLSDFDTFIRRMKEIDTASGVYDGGVVEEVPCYAGWLFARIMTTGNVVPCCKGHRMHMGNIFKNRFKEIWFSDTYNEFRNNGLKLAKAHPYFSKIGNDASPKTGCYNCDNLWQNVPVHRKITGIKEKGPIADLSVSLLRGLF
ncbi:MAG: radical SAM protein [Candidatus Omnitrophota bacterium]|jgi:MoaA/NifB/PqqE/SkfB family radical SAM enzyme